ATIASTGMATTSRQMAGANTATAMATATIPTATVSLDAIFRAAVDRRARRSLFTFHLDQMLKQATTGARPTHKLVDPTPRPLPQQSPVSHEPTMALDVAARLHALDAPLQRILLFKAPEDLRILAGVADPTASTPSASSAAEPGTTMTEADKQRARATLAAAFAVHPDAPVATAVASASHSRFISALACAFEPPLTSPPCTSDLAALAHRPLHDTALASAAVDAFLDELTPAAGLVLMGHGLTATSELDLGLPPTAGECLRAFLQPHEADVRGRAKAAQRLRLRRQRPGSDEAGESSGSVEQEADTESVATPVATVSEEGAGEDGKDAFPTVGEPASTPHADEEGNDDMTVPTTFLTVGARALAKHAHRSSAGFGWGGAAVVTGTVAEKNAAAVKAFATIFEECVWRNMLRLPHNTIVYEVRSYLGHGLRFHLVPVPESVTAGQDPGDSPSPPSFHAWQAEFRGCLEPPMADGHEKRWRS
ncbi:hypothetical protein HK405_008067, partial [Cladochytrium tenue]